jgi:hypothetical protein
MRTFCKIFVLLLLAGSHAIAVSSYTGGHADIGVALENGTDFHLHLHTHTGAVIDGVPSLADNEFDAGDVQIIVPGSTAQTAPANIPELGVMTGDTIWILPQSNPNTDTIPFLGIGTEELTPANWTGDITFELDSVVSPSGSGTFSLSQGAGLSTDYLFVSSNPALSSSGDNSFDVIVGGHDHFDFGFNELGDWQVELTVSGMHNSLGALTDTQTFGFTVIPEPSTYALLIGSAFLLLAIIRKRFF